MPSSQDGERAVVGKVAADLLGETDAHLLGDLLGPSRVRRDFRDRLQDETKIADGDALGKQELQGCEQRGLRDLRRAYVVEQPFVLGFEAIEQRAHVLVR